MSYFYNAKKLFAQIENVENSKLKIVKPLQKVGTSRKFYVWSVRYFIKFLYIELF